MDNLQFCVNLPSHVAQTLLVSLLEESICFINPVCRFFIRCCFLPPCNYRIQDVSESLNVLTIRNSRANVFRYVRVSPITICDEDSCITHNCKHVENVSIVSHKFAPQARTQSEPVIKEIRNQVILRHREHICGDASSFDIIDLLSRAWLLSCGYTDQIYLSSICLIARVLRLDDNNNCHTMYASWRLWACTSFREQRLPGIPTFAAVNYLSS